TGRLLPPVLAAATKASWIRTFAEREGINLSESFAYSDSMSDLPMLSIVGHPAVVNPDFRLRQTALHHDWPILSLKGATDEHRFIQIVSGLSVSVSVNLWLKLNYGLTT